MEQDTWLHNSLFCERSAWGKLLKNGIPVFVEMLLQERSIRFYQIAFNYSGGANIRLALFALQDDAPVLAKRTDEWFKDYFKNADFPYDAASPVGDQLFMQFPANSIQYGLYEVTANSSADNSKVYQFQMSLSSAITAALSGEDIVDETILTLAFYLHTTWLKNLSNYAQAPVADLLPCYQFSGIEINEETIDDDFLQQKYGENRDILLEIADSIFHPHETVDDIPGWLLLWNNACRDYIHYSMTRQQSKQDHHKTVHLMNIPVINSFLGMNENMRRLLGHFIRETLLMVPA